jgi:nucleotide-binding universal stress UspA family protein
VLPYAKTLQQKLGSQVELIRVIEEPHLEPSNPSYNSYLEQMLTARQSESANYLQELAESLREDGLAVSWSVKLGDPATVIGNLADSHLTTLVTMCSHGRSGLSRWWIGSTTDKVIHSASSAVLVVRAQSNNISPVPTEFQDCIVPLDGSARAEHVLRHVPAWVKAFSLKVNLITVVPELDSHTLEWFPEAADEDRIGKAGKYLEGIKTRLLDQGVSDVEATLKEGYPANVLVDLARNSSESLMIMGTEGLGDGGIYRWTMGSVSQRVVGNSSAPVLVIRTREVATSDLD